MIATSPSKPAIYATRRMPVYHRGPRDDGQAAGGVAAATASVESSHWSPPARQLAVSLPILNDTIVAVSTGWEPAPVGVVRLSGPDCVALLHGLGVELPVQTRLGCNAATLRLSGGIVLPATVFVFRAPRSYTGQDVVELHTVGCRPLLRELCAQLIGAGARRALPGEFTARALRTGRLDARQAAGVLALLQSSDESQVRLAARQALTSQRQIIADAKTELTRLLAAIEAGIDFADEEDVRFVSPLEVAHSIDGLLSRLNAACRRAPRAARTARPHLAIAGLPNAGKSTLFNALLGYQRALVSPVLGTTRDVLSAEITLGGVTAVLQDCAGLGGGADELALATHLATEQATAQADLVLWVHAADTAWDARETAACAALAVNRPVLVWTKLDTPTRHRPDRVPAQFAECVAVSAFAGTGIDELRALLVRRVADLPPTGTDLLPPGDWAAAYSALERVRNLAGASPGPQLAAAELISLELRVAYAALADANPLGLDEDVLARIFSQFCVGK